MPIDLSSSYRQVSLRRLVTCSCSARVTRQCARANRSSWAAVIGMAIAARSRSLSGAAIRVSARTLA